MGQISTAPTVPSIILSAIDRLIAANADGGITPGAAHVILLGEQAGLNLSVSNIIAQGQNALRNLADIRLTGSIVIGESSSLAAGVAGGLVDPAGALTVVGSGSGTNLAFAGSSVMIGDSILTIATQLNNSAAKQMVLIGSHAATNLGGNPNLDGLIAIGFNAVTQAQSGDATHQASYTELVAIGDQVLSSLGSGIASKAYNGVYIGAGAGLGSGAVGPVTSNVVIGQSAGQAAAQMRNCVIIGHSACGTTNNDDIIAIGFGCGLTAPTGGDCILIGKNIPNQGVINTRSGNLFLGNMCNFAATIYTDKFLVEMNTVGVKRALLFGDLATGNLVIGQSTEGTDRDLSGTNTLKLINGTAGGANPIGGGRAYVTAGELHWLASSGLDVNLSPAGQLASRATAFTNNAAGQAATITNSPLAGNPTKWIPINDNGTIRNVPAW